MSLFPLRLRDRDMGGTDRPLSTDIVEIIEGESLLFQLPINHVMVNGLTVESVTSSLKTGGGVVIDSLAVSVGGLEITGRIRTTTTQTRSCIAAIQMTLSNADVWEVNVPIWVADP